jgi:aspartyl-tRNA(Asn)/glutamyl-tRNA(Gln) amidotransferase subunit B
MDAHVSVRDAGATALHSRTTIASLHSVEDLREALEVEFARQCALRDEGSAVERCTLSWDGAARRVLPADADAAADPGANGDGGRLLVDPDLPPLVLGDEWLARVRREMPELAGERLLRFVRDYGLEVAQARLLVAERPLADYFEQAARHYCRQRADYAVVAKWILGEMLASLRDTGMQVREFRVRPADLAALLGFVRAGTLSRARAAAVWRRIVCTGELPAEVVEREVLAPLPTDVTPAR